ncbi:zinc finger and SCAN domain-containing protein 5B [Trichonephila clavipes]|nr:zinc finger and SCAN domain-containing protein 5B [Trichonephila clavipes]
MLSAHLPPVKRLPILIGLKFELKVQDISALWCRFRLKLRRSFAASWNAIPETPQGNSNSVFQCELCPFRSLSSRDLGNHLLEHADDRNVCPLCGRAFVQRSGLRTHFRIHTKERPFACGECDERFSYKHVLRDHQLLHAGIKPYSCPYCKKGFVQQSNMKLHLVKHKAVLE